MGLIVSPAILIFDIILLLAIGYATFYSIRRVNRYPEPFNRFLLVVSVSTFLATVGRVLDIVDDFFQVPDYVGLSEEALYFISILGVIYGIVSYIRAVEMRMMPTPETESLGSVPAGGFLFFGRRPELVEFLRALEVPAVVFTRDPWAYKGLKNVQTVWVTTASEEGVPPTKLHVLLDIAVNFFKKGGKLVVIDCIETLILYNDFPSVFRFLTALKDHAFNFGATLLVLLERETLDKQQEMILRRELRELPALGELLKTSS